MRCLRNVFGVLALTLLVVFASPTVHAVQPDEVLKDPKLESRARALSAELRCLVCQNQSIDDSDAPLARDLRVLIRERLTKGDSDSQVMSFVVDRYGEFVLLKPRFAAHTLVLWLGPFLILLAGIAVVVHQRRRRADPANAKIEAELTDDEARKLEQLLNSKDQ